MVDLIETMVSSGSLTRDQADRARARGEDLAKNASAAPASLHAYLEKTAGTVNWGQVGTGVATALGIGVAAKGADSLIGAVSNSLAKARNYKMMLASNPGLRSFPAAQVQRAFEVLQSFSPQFASNPTVAASFVERAIRQGSNSESVLPMSIPQDWVNALTQANKNMAESDSKREGFLQDTLKRHYRP